MIERLKSCGELQSSRQTSLLTASNGDQIRVSYEIGEFVEPYYRAPASWFPHLAVKEPIYAGQIHVSLLRQNETAEKVRAVVTNKCGFGNQRREAFMKTFDLEPGDQSLVFNGWLRQDSLPLFLWAEGEYRCTQEIAIEVDRSWLQDPVNGSHNFSFNMGWRY